jgi:hypothetical protein
MPGAAATYVLVWTSLPPQSKACVKRGNQKERVFSHRTRKGFHGRNLDSMVSVEVGRPKRGRVPSA